MLHSERLKRVELVNTLSEPSRAGPLAPTVYLDL